MTWNLLSWSLYVIWITQLESPQSVLAIETHAEIADGHVLPLILENQFKRKKNYPKQESISRNSSSISASLRVLQLNEQVTYTK